MIYALLGFYRISVFCRWAKSTFGMMMMMMMMMTLLLVDVIMVLTMELLLFNIMFHWWICHNRPHHIVAHIVGGMFGTYWSHWAQHGMSVKKNIMIVVFSSSHIFPVIVIVVIVATQNMWGRRCYWWWYVCTVRRQIVVMRWR